MLTKRLASRVLSDGQSSACAWTIPFHLSVQAWRTKKKRINILNWIAAAPNGAQQFIAVFLVAAALCVCIHNLAYALHMDHQHDAARRGSNTMVSVAASQILLAIEVQHAKHLLFVCSRCLQRELCAA